MKKDNKGWIVLIFILTFILSIVFSTVSNLITANVSNMAVLFILLIGVIVIGILFDAIGTAALTAKEATFHSMSSSRVKGAKESLSLIKNSNKISTLCNDVVGDVCGIISGGLGAVIAIGLSYKLDMSNTLIAVLLSSFISSFTVGGKAIMKRIALNNADNIVFMVGKVKCFLHIK